MKNNIGANIKHFRKLRNLSQTELADKMDISRQGISSWENDRTEPSMGDIEKLSKILSCRKTELLGIDERTEEQKELDAIAEAYKNADEETKAVIRRLLAYAERMKK